MKKINFLVLMSVAVVAIALSSCGKAKKDEITPAAVDVTMVTLEGDITESKTLDASLKYLIKGKVYVQAPAVLTIPAGTVLMGDKPTQGALIINRGAQIIANGTATQPIVMTSNAPIGFRNRGDWGGLILLGNADNNKGTNVTLEGISAATGENGLHGPGAGAAQNTQSSGSLKFVRIEFAGVALSDDNELNSLTMGSVGSGTVLENIMVSYANDDAYEWFGGSVNAKYLIAYSTWDDDLDTDQGYTGTVQYGLVVRDPDVADKSGSRVWESSSSTAAATPTSAPKFSNFTVFGPLCYAKNSSSGTVNANYRAAVEVNTSSAVKIYNSLILGFGDAIAGATAGQINNCVFGYFPTGDELLGTNLVLDSLVNIYGSSFSGKKLLPNGVTGATDNLSLAGNAVIGLNNTAIAPLLAASSAYASGAPNVSAEGFTAENYYGAFGTSANAGWSWGTSWINFDPINATY